MQEIQTVLGRRIRQFRSKRGWSQEDFADICGLHRTYMGSVERGERNLTLHSLFTISKALGMTLSELVSGLEKMEADGSVRGVGTSNQTPVQATAPNPIAKRRATDSITGKKGRTA